MKYLLVALMFFQLPNSYSKADLFANWKHSNQKFSNELNQGKSIDVKSLIWKETPTRLFNFNDPDIYLKEENEHYSVICYFRGNVLAFNKRTKGYFPVILKNCSAGCNTIPELKGKTLILTFDEGKAFTLTIDLQTKRITVRD